uniref:Glutathione synthetase n=1 Tax=Plectus sambesii TaxID=2011161 RepID=A0A914WBA4_9BILA
MAYPTLPLDAALLDRLVSDSKDWAQSHGLVMRTREHKDKSDICQTAPFALLPSSFPRSLYEQAVNVEEDMNLLYFLVSWDYEFIKESLAEVIETDEFTRRLMDIYTEVHKEGLAQTKVVQIQRSDYMCHSSPDGSHSIKQVEVNNIASSFGGLGELCTKMHTATLHYLGFDTEKLAQSIPENRCLSTVATGIYQAWLAYGESNGLVVFLVEDVNQNQLDQRHVEYRLSEFSDRRARVERLTLTDCAHRLELCEKTKVLRLDGKDEVAVIYFRAGYVPDQYKSDLEWAGRLKIERSKAIKTPWIGLQLANTKKIQQVLAKPGALERFLPNNPEKVAAIRATFAGMWGLESSDANTKTIVDEALAHPEKFVLKPQLEGGGGNFYGAEVANKLTKLSAAERSAFILMERIHPMINT